MIVLRLTLSHTSDYPSLHLLRDLQIQGANVTLELFKKYCLKTI